MTLEIVVGDLIPDDVIEQINEQAVYKIVANIADGARDEWIRLAGQLLSASSRTDYIDAIQPVVHRPGFAMISLVGQPANLIENGISEVDLRDWLLGSKIPVAPRGQKGKRRAKAGHFYRSVPFRHATPTSIGVTGQPMGDPYRGVVKQSGALGRAVYNQAKNLVAGEKLPAHMRYGRGKKMSVPKLRAHHKTDIYAGMVKLRGAYKKTVQTGGYTTFRTISNATKAVEGTQKGGKPGLVGWIRPQTQGKALAPKVQTYIERVAPAAFQAYVAGLSGS